MTRLLAATVFVAVLAFSAVPASAQYPFGGFYGGYATAYMPQPYYGGYSNYGYYNNYGYGSNYGSNYGYSSNYGNRYSNRNYYNRSSNHSHNHSHPVTTVQLPGGGSITGSFKNVITLPPGATVQGF